MVAGDLLIRRQVQRPYAGRAQTRRVTLRQLNVDGCDRSQYLVSYEGTVDNSGEESGFVYVSRIRTVAQLQRSEFERAGASKRGNLFGSGLSSLGST